MLVSLIVPAHNEEGNLRRLADRVRSELAVDSFNHDIEILLINDNSTDRTGEICDELAAEHSEVQVVHRAGDPGFGNALKTGFTAATGDVIVPFMGDLSDDPADIMNLVEAIENGYDIAYGSRFISGGSVDGYSGLKLFYNRAFNNTIRLLFGIQARDITNAFTAYHREVIDEIDPETLVAESFDITVELPLRAHIQGFRNTEVPVSWRSRDAGVSKLNATRKGPLYGKRLLKLFLFGNVAALRDLYSAITTGSPVRMLAAAVVGVALLVALFSLSGFETVFSVVSNVRPKWLVAGSLVYLFSFAFRTWRYRVLLRTTEHLATRAGVFRAILASWFINFILPARIGDAVRGVALKTTENVSFGVATGMVVIERIMDMVVLGTALLTVGLLIIPYDNAVLLGLGAFGIAGVLLVGLLVLYVFDDRIKTVFASNYPAIRSGLDALDTAINRAFRNPTAMVLALLLTIPVWILEAGTLLLSARALGIQIALGPGILAALSSFIAQAVPVTPAGIGTYEATITGVLGVFGVSTGVGTGLALTDHFLRIATVYIVGAVAIIHIGFQSRTYFRDRQFSAADAGDPVPNE